MTMSLILRGAVIVALVATAGACSRIPQDGGPTIIADGFDRGPFNPVGRTKHLSELRAAIAIDPDGCHTWFIDDGAQGYWTRRRDPRTGLPVCTPIAPPGSIVGDPFASAPNVPDIAR